MLCAGRSFLRLGGNIRGNKRLRSEVSCLAFLAARVATRSELQAKRMPFCSQSKSEARTSSEETDSGFRREGCVRCDIRRLLTKKP